MEERAEKFLEEAGFIKGSQMFNDLKAKLVEFANLEVNRAMKLESDRMSSGGWQ